MTFTSEIAESPPDRRRRERTFEAKTPAVRFLTYRSDDMIKPAPDNMLFRTTICQ
jgi:hypothetical protein